MVGGIQSRRSWPIRCRFSTFRVIITDSSLQPIAPSRRLGCLLPQELSQKELSTLTLATSMFIVDRQI
jgi:hypothetical protein